ncbi:hypothetical protein RhiirA4_465233 [Rhizophagus irregularis]|uniref:Uncharacterized protein n=1 Tax=Rhizophagus irregularis TaxID=588596 RepID=A0A2I1GRY0_9GLOM|nr:hypothetical protein RhiirA4_465233 [Rhizophagus irregularis]
MFVPHKYRNIIPPDPIYNQDGLYIVPGSREWFTFMYKLEKQLAIEAAEKRHQEFLRKEQLAVEEERLKSLQSQLAYAAYHGTNSKASELYNGRGIIGLWTFARMLLTAVGIDLDRKGVRIIYLKGYCWSWTFARMLLTAIEKRQEKVLLGHGHLRA